MKPTKFLSEAVALCGAMAISFTSVLAASPASASAQLGPEAKAKQTAAAKAALDKAEIFYTGKPYDADAQEYIFAARNYDPTVARWTSVDPSGFPDGANNRIYTTTPNKQLDPDGKAIIFLSPLDYFSPSIVAAAAEWNYLEAGALATGNLMIVDSVPIGLTHTNPEKPQSIVVPEWRGRNRLKLCA